MGNYHQEFLDKLAKLMVGWTVVGVENHDNWEALCTFILAQGGQRRKVDLCATDLGAWVLSVRDTLPSGQEVYTDLAQVLDAVSLHLHNHEPDLTFATEFGEVAPDPYPLEALEDARNRAFGFRCPQTETEWWVSLTAIRKHPLRTLFGQPEDRQEVARRLVEEGPHPFCFPELKPEDVKGGLWRPLSEVDRRGKVDQ